MFDFDDPGNLKALLAFLAAFAIVAVWKLVDQWRDARQKTYQDIADDMTLIGQDVIGDFFKALARDDYEEAMSIAKAVAARLKKPGGAYEVITAMMAKSLKDRDYTESDPFKTVIQPILTERVLGTMFSPELKAELMMLLPVLREYGSVQFADVVNHLVLGNLEAARAAGHQLVSVLRNEDQLDDELVKRATKAIPRIIQADPRHWQTLKTIIDNAEPLTTVAKK